MRGSRDDVLVSPSSAINPKLAVGRTGEPVKFTYTDRDVRIYALAVGVSTRQPYHLKFLYEGHPNFCPLPSYATIPALCTEWPLIDGKIPGIKIDQTQVIHGEHYLELYKPLRTSATLTSVATVADVMDKGSGPVILYNVETTDETGEKAFFNQISEYIYRAGGYGGSRTSDKIIPICEEPQRPPDKVVVEKTGIDQAALFNVIDRKTNPIHMDPLAAAKLGWSAPVLSGLCVLGYAVRHVLESFCNNDVSMVKAIKVGTLLKPVIPGQSLTSEMWKEGSRVHIRAKVTETNSVCLTGAYVDLQNASGST